MQYLLQILLVNIFIKEECLKMSVITKMEKKSMPLITCQKTIFKELIFMSYTSL